MNSPAGCSRPFVSVVMAIYNGAATLARAIESVRTRGIGGQI